MDDGYLGLVCSVAETASGELADGDESFFLAFGFRKPHLPVCAPKKDWEPYEREWMPAPEFAMHPQNVPELAVRRWMELESHADIPLDGQLTEE